MKQLFNRTFCFFMALQVLVASTGFATTEHWCALKGKKTLVFVKAESCCTAPSSAASSNKPLLKRSKCCQEQTIFNKLSTSASQGNQSELKEAAPVLAVLPSLVFTPQLVAFEPLLLKIALYFSSSPPPLAGRARLIFIQSFLI